MSDTSESFWRRHAGEILVGLIGSAGAIAAAIVPVILNQPASAPADNAAQNKVVATSVPAAAPAAVVDERPRVVRDLEQIQGEWEVISREEPAEVKAKLAARAKARSGDSAGTPRLVVWQFRGNELTIRVTRADGTDGPTLRGTFGLREDRHGKARLFDFNGRSSADGEFVWAGIYELEGDSLRVCYRDRDRSPKGHDHGRAIAFHTDLDRGGGTFRKLKKRS